MYKKNQHTVAQVIQRKFSIDNKKVYGIKEIPTKNAEGIKYELNKFSIENTMSDDWCYEAPMSYNLEINTLENYFSLIENNYAKLLDNLISLIEDRKSFKFIKEFIFNNFMVCFLELYYRTFQCIFLGNKNNSIEKQREEIYSRFEHTLFDIEYLKRLSITIKDCYHMHILESPSESFLLSDSFISTASINFKGFGTTSPYFLNRSIGLNKIFILIPISAKYYILFTDDNEYKNHYIKIFDKDILKYNSIIFRNSYMFTVGKNKDILKYTRESVHKYFFGFDYVGGNYEKPEIWVDENIDKLYYSNSCHDKKELESKIQHYGLLKNKYGHCYQIERSVFKKNNSHGFKCVNSNPKYNQL